MRHIRLYRFTAALLGALFALALGSEALAVHPCPMHEGVLAATAEHHAGHGGESAQPASGHHEQQTPAKGQCCCPDSGCCSGIVALALPAVPPLGAPVARDVLLPASRETRASPRGQHLLPFANGPPHASLA